MNDTTELDFSIPGYDQVASDLAASVKRLPARQQRRYAKLCQQARDSDPSGFGVDMRLVLLSLFKDVNDIIHLSIVIQLVHDITRTDSYEYAKQRAARMAKEN
jgi:hypothetical protein